MPSEEGPKIIELPCPNLEHVCKLIVTLGPIREMGSGRAGQRRIIPIVGGHVTGPHLSGKILNVGADWQTIFGDGLAELETRYAVETDDGATIEIINYGFRRRREELKPAIRSKSSRSVTSAQQSLTDTAQNLRFGYRFAGDILMKLGE